MSEACKHCGRCPTCGQSVPAVVIAPLPYWGGGYPWWPYTVPTTPYVPPPWQQDITLTVTTGTDTTLTLVQ